MKLLDKLKKNEFWSSVFKLSAGQLIGQAITLAATLVLSRIYTDADYGTFGIITSTAAIVTSVISLALGSAIMGAETDEDSKRVFTVSYLIQLVLLAIVLIGMIALMPVKRFFDTSIPYIAAVCLMGVHIAFNILFTMTRVYINRMKMDNILFWNSLINAGCTVFISIPMGLLGFGFVGLLGASIMAEALCAAQMIFASCPFKKIRSFGEVKQTFIECKRFMLFQSPSNIMGTFSNNMPNQTLYNMFGNAELGSYAMCNKIFNLPLNLLIAPIQTVYFRTAAQMKDKLEELADFTYNFLKKLMLIAAVPMIICMAFGEYIFGFVLGSQWQEAGLIAAIMCPYFLFWFCYNAITYLRVTIGHQKTNLYMTIVQLIFALLAVLIAKICTADIIVTIALFSGINGLFSLANIVVSFACMRKYYFKYCIMSILYIAICIAVALVLRLVV